MIAMKDILRKRFHYLRNDWFALVVMLAAVAFGLLGLPGLVFTSTRNEAQLLIILCFALCILLEILYRHDREWFRKWKIYRSNMNIPAITATTEGDSYYQDDEKYYKRLIKAMDA